MKKFALVAVSAALLSAPAFAETITVEFADVDGTKVVVAFDSAAGTATVDGEAFPSAYDAATNTVCTQAPDGEICATMESEAGDVGSSSAYTTNQGGSGTATVLAKG